MTSFNRLLLLLSAFVFFLTQFATAAKYSEWGDLPDCVQFCIKYQAINAGLDCQAQDPRCYCNQPAWHAPMKDCIYDGKLADCKTTVQTSDKENILKYIDEVFCPTLNGTKQASSASSSQVRVAAATSESEGSSSTSTTSDPKTSSTSTSESSSSSSSSSTSPPSASEDDDVSTTTATSTSTSTSPSSSSAEASSAPTTTTSPSSSAADTSSLPSSFSSIMSATTTVIVVTANVSHTTRPSTSTTITNFVQDTVTATDGAVPGAHVLFYDGHMEAMLGVSSTMALVLVIVGMVVLVG